MGGDEAADLGVGVTLDGDDEPAVPQRLLVSLHHIAVVSDVLPAVLAAPAPLRLDLAVEAHQGRMGGTHLPTLIEVAGDRLTELKQCLAEGGAHHPGRPVKLPPIACGGMHHLKEGVGRLDVGGEGDQGLPADGGGGLIKLLEHLVDGNEGLVGRTEPQEGDALPDERLALSQGVPFTDEGQVSEVGPPLLGAALALDTSEDGVEAQRLNTLLFHHSRLACASAQSSRPCPSTLDPSLRGSRPS